jgi:hypothetical protein
MVAVRYRIPKHCSSLSARMPASTCCSASNGDQLLMEHMFSSEGEQDSLFVRT